MSHFLGQSLNIYFYLLSPPKGHEDILSKWANTTSYQMGYANLIMEFIDILESCHWIIIYFKI